MLESILGSNTFAMEQKITIDNQTTIKLFALAAAIIALYFLSKKYI